MEKKKRSITKTLTWRIVALFLNIFLVYYITGKVSFALGAGGIITIINLVIFYFHERAWNKVDWGRRQKI